MREKKKKERPTTPNILHKIPLSDNAKQYILKIFLEYIEDIFKRAENQASAEGADVVSKCNLIKAQHSLFCRPKKKQDNIKFLTGSLFGVFAAIIVNDFIEGSILGTTHLIIILLMIICVLVYSSFIR